MVGHRSGIRILESRGPGAPLAVVRETPFPYAELKGADVVTDRPGRKPHPGHLQARRAAMEQQDPVKHYVELFAKQVADELDKDRASGKFQRLVLVSEPSFLGMLRDHLSETTSRMVEATLAKDLADAEPTKVRESLEDRILV